MNFESRQETLRHHKVLETFTWCHCYRYSPRPETLYFHPEIDVLRIKCKYLQIGINVERHWDLHFKTGIEEFASSVRFLEIICVSLHCEEEDLEEGEIKICQEGILGKIDGLQELRILDVGHSLPAEFDQISDQLRLDGPGGQLMINAHTKFFQLLAASKPGSAIPKVTIRKFLSSRVDVNDLSDLNW